MLNNSNSQESDLFMMSAVVLFLSCSKLFMYKHSFFFFKLYFVHNKLNSTCRISIPHHVYYYYKKLVIVVRDTKIP